MKKVLNKEIRRQIKAADRLIIEEGGCTHAYTWYGWWGAPVSKYADKGDRRHIRAAAKIAVKAFARDCEGHFTRPAKERAEAREQLAAVIFAAADEATCRWLAEQEAAE